MQKVIGIPNGPSYQTKLNELNNLLELGWKVINVSPIEKTSVYSSGVMYIIELINKPVETTNEQPKSETIFEIRCDKPGGCACDTFAYIASCKYSHEPSGNRDLWMIDSEDREG